MKLAYVLSGHKNPEQFRWLLDAIWHPNDRFVVHIDAKTSDGTYRRFVDAVGDRPNVVFLTREKVTWAGYGLVSAEVRAMRLLIDNGLKFDHLVNLSLQCFPTRARDELIAELGRNPDRNYVAMRPLADTPWHVRRRKWLYSFEIGNKLVRTPIPRLIPRDLRIEWKGSVFHILSHAFCEWLIGSQEAARYLRFFRFTESSDEMAFQNIIMDSPFRQTVTKRNAHFIKWQKRSPHPYTLRLSHLPEIEQSNAFFARKFDLDMDGDVMAHLASRIGAPVPGDRARSKTYSSTLSSLRRVPA